MNELGSVENFFAEAVHILSQKPKKKRKTKKAETTNT